ncbi:DUF2505 domain-containing protein [Cellulomonas timonensis]|uniref:DUF2505 domain-containing protein n=1 Tax=Cellulomonas timonensis TaxID=1689271 RepID=UPI000AB357E5|nr:DUF2505 domain-containing protein [Cellulomonas timonensis]
MHLRISFTLAASPTTVAAMLADPAYVEAKVRASGAIEQQVDVVPAEDGAFTVTSRRALPTDQIPANMRAFIGSQIDVRQVEAWEPPGLDNTRAGTVVVEISGAPVRLTGSIRLSAEGAGSAIVYEGDLKAAIPLFAGAVEDAAASAIRSALAAEEAVATAWLQGHEPGSQP